MFLFFFLFPHIVVLASFFFVVNGYASLCTNNAYLHLSLPSFCLFFWRTALQHTCGIDRTVGRWDVFHYKNL
jgi:hypothetical protein